MKKYIIIVAGGKGLRMGSEIPKQFLLLNNKPVLMHTLEAFYQYDPQIHIIVVLPEQQQDYWKSLCITYNFSIPHSIANGGETRFHSVKNGLQLVESGSLVGVHDGVRPFVARQVIENCFRQVITRKAVIPVIAVYETVRQLTEKGSSITVNRENYRLVQTPQVFITDLLKEAYQQPFNDKFTDDASVVEASGISVSLIEGNRENIKITTPFDIKIANALTDV